MIYFSSLSLKTHTYKGFSKMRAQSLRLCTKCNLPRQTCSIRVPFFLLLVSILSMLPPSPSLYRYFGTSTQHCRLKLSWNQLYLFSFPWNSTFFVFWLYHMVCRILVPQPGIQSMSPVVEVQRLNHWTTREVLLELLLSLISSMWYFSCFFRPKLTCISQGS